MVALVNHGKKSHNITVEWKELGFDDGTWQRLLMFGALRNQLWRKMQQFVHFACALHGSAVGVTKCCESSTRVGHAERLHTNSGTVRAKNCVLGVWCSTC